MSDGFQVVPGELNTHADSVNGFGDQLTAAGDKGRGVDLGIGTYGIIGQAFSGGVRSNISQTGGSINEMGTALKDAATGVRECAKAYQQVDQDNSKLFGGS
jgi:uncharacterized protein YukE